MITFKKKNIYIYITGLLFNPPKNVGMPFFVYALWNFFMLRPYHWVWPSGWRCQFTRKKNRASHGSDYSSRVRSGQSHPARPVMLENLLIRPNPTREISNTSWPGPTRPASFFFKSWTDRWKALFFFLGVRYRALPDEVTSLRKQWWPCPVACVDYSIGTHETTRSAWFGGGASDAGLQNAKESCTTAHARMDELLYAWRAQNYCEETALFSCVVAIHSVCTTCGRTISTTVRPALTDEGSLLPEKQKTSPKSSDKI